jgi:hypothetical protein
MEVSLPLARTNQALTHNLYTPHLKYSPAHRFSREARALTKERRQEIARKAAAARWGKKV